MINAILSGIFKVIITLVSVLLYPIDALILTLLPDLSNALTSIGAFFNLIGQCLGWVVSVSGLSSQTISLIVLYFVFKLTAPLMFYLVKLALSWYNKLKP